MNKAVGVPTIYINKTMAIKPRLTRSVIVLINVKYAEEPNNDDSILEPMAGYIIMTMINDMMLSPTNGDINIR